MNTKLAAALAISAAIGLVACARKEEAAPNKGAETQAPAAATETPPAEESAMTEDAGDAIDPATIATEPMTEPAMETPETVEGAPESAPEAAVDETMNAAPALTEQAAPETPPAPQNE